MSISFIVTHLVLVVIYLLYRKLGLSLSSEIELAFVGGYKQICKLLWVYCPGHEISFIPKHEEPTN